MDIKRLVKQAKQENKEALLQLIFLEKANYYRLAFSYLKNEEDSLDALEDMIVQLYENIHQLKKDELFYSWSKTILVNICKKRLKQQQKIVPLHEDERIIDSHEENNVQSLYVQQLLNNLNEHQKEAIELKYFFDFDLKTIANVTNSSLGTVKSRIHTGLQKLNQIVRSEKE